MYKRKWLTIVIGILMASILLSSQLLMGCSSTSPTQSTSVTTKTDSAADFYKGKSVTIVVPSDPGGSADTLARLAVDVLNKTTQTQWGVINEGAGSGLPSTNNFCLTTKADGLTIMCTSTGKIWPGWLLNDPNVNYDITKLKYLGTIKGGPLTLVVSAAGPYNTLEALKQGKGLRFCARQPSSLLNWGNIMAIKTLGLDAKIIAGFKGTPEMMLSIEQGEAEATVNSGEGVFTAEKDGKFKGLLQINMEKDNNYPNWPSLADTVKFSDEDKKLMGALFFDGKLFAAPPGTPDDRVKFLEENLAAAFSDATFQKGASDIAGMWLGAISGAETVKIVTGLETAKPEMSKYTELINKYVK